MYLEQTASCCGVVELTGISTAFWKGTKEEKKKFKELFAEIIENNYDDGGVVWGLVYYCPRDKTTTKFLTWFGRAFKAKKFVVPHRSPGHGPGTIEAFFVDLSPWAKKYKDKYNELSHDSDDDPYGW